MGSPINGSRYEIRLRGAEVIPGHLYDEWDCIADIEFYGLIENRGTDSNPVFRLTEAGGFIAGPIRAHRAAGHSWGTFQVSEAQMGHWMELAGKPV